MMLTLIETSEREPMPHITRQEAARLLEEFRALYQTLALEERGQVKSHFAELGQSQARQTQLRVSASSCGVSTGCSDHNRIC